MADDIDGAPSEFTSDYYGSSSPTLEDLVPRTQLSTANSDSIAAYGTDTRSHVLSKPPSALRPRGTVRLVWRRCRSAKSAKYNSKPFRANPPNLIPAKFNSRQFFRPYGSACTYLVSLCQNAVGEVLVV